MEQLQSMMIPACLLDPTLVEAARQSHLAGYDVDDVPAEKWEDFTLKTPFRRELFLRADTYRPFLDVWDGLPQKRDEGIRFGDWMMYAPVLKAGHRLRMYQKAGDGPAKMGWVQFDRDIAIPSLNRKTWGNYEPIMSLSPFECISVKTGARFAKDKVVITGLGMGYLLWLVHQRPQVKHITVIEIDDAVINHVWSRVRKHM